VRPENRYRAMEVAMPRRHLPMIALAVLLTALAGCRQAGLTADGWIPPELPLDLGEPAAAACAPDVAAGPISTVAAPEGARRPVSLAECLCLALEHGRTGEFFDRADSERRTSVTGLQLQAPASGASDSLRVFAYDPAIANTDVEQSLSRFDVLWRTGIDWTRVNPPPGIDSAAVPLVGVLNGQEETTQFRTELLKPLPTGGMAGITFRTDYARSFPPLASPVLNPAYSPGVELSFEQPLLQGAGVLINELRQTFPASMLHPFPSSAVPPEGRSPGPAILLARLARDESRLEFERRVQQLLFAVEEAYWDLYCAYWDLYSRDNGLTLTHLTWQTAKARYDAKGIGVEDLAQVEEQYYFFRTERLQALGRGVGGRPGVLEAERRLRYVVGLPPEDGTRLVPTDEPATAPIEPSWDEAVNTARRLRPELLQVQKEIAAAQLALTRAQDFLLPDLRFVSRYGLNGLGGTLGAGFRSLGDDPFANWELGLQLQVPIGYRAAHAEVTRAKLLLAQRYHFLRDDEVKIVLSLQRSYRDVIQFREELATRRGQREAAGVQLKARFLKFKAGGGTIDLLLRAQRTWVDSLRDEQLAVCRYNVALADLERQKGTIMLSHNVKVVEGGLPVGADPQASEHVRHAQPVAEAPAAAPQHGRLARLLEPQATDIRSYLSPAELPPLPRLLGSTAGTP
jgi:outer membrane protein TolC